MKPFHLHLVSDSTGETVSSVARAVLSQFEGLDAEEHNWALIRTKGQLDKVLKKIKENPGFVMYTIVDEELRHYLKEGCEEMNMPCVSVLSRVITDLSGFLGMNISSKPGKRHVMDKEYFSRVEAINFALTHDDGQLVWDLDEADIVLVGASRTSKSPTSMYLAFRGYRAANVPYVGGIDFPEEVSKLKKTLVVALTITPEMLCQIRKNRMLSINENSEKTDYTNLESIKEELNEARKFFVKNDWPIIDVTRRSVEETVAKIIQIKQKRDSK